MIVSRMHKLVWWSSIWFAVSIVCFNWLYILLGWISIMPRLLNKRRFDEQYLGVWNISSIFTKGNLLLLLEKLLCAYFVFETWILFFRCFWNLDIWSFVTAIISQSKDFGNVGMTSENYHAYIFRNKKKVKLLVMYMYIVYHGFMIMILLNSSIGGYPPSRDGLLIRTFSY